MTTISVSRDCFRRVENGVSSVCKGAITFETNIITFQYTLSETNIEWIKEELIHDGWTIDDLTN